MKPINFHLDNPTNMSFARNWLSLQTRKLVSGRIRNCTPADYDWFGCKNDSELEKEIYFIAATEGETDLVKVLKLMYYG